MLCNIHLTTRGTQLGQVVQNYSPATWLSLLFSKIELLVDGVEKSMVNYYMGIIVLLLLPMVFSKQNKNRIFISLFMILLVVPAIKDIMNLNVSDKVLYLSRCIFLFTLFIAIGSSLLGNVFSAQLGEETIAKCITLTDSAWLATVFVAGYLSFLLSDTANFKTTYRNSIISQNPVAYFTNNVVTNKDVDYAIWANSGDAPAEQIYVDKSWENDGNELIHFRQEKTKEISLSVKNEAGQTVVSGNLKSGKKNTNRVRLYYDNNVLVSELPMLVTFMDTDAVDYAYNGTYQIFSEEGKRYIDIYLPDRTKTYESLTVSSCEVMPKSAELVTVKPMQKDDYVDVKSFRLNSITMKVNADRGGYLSLLQAWHSGWNAYVDGEKVDISKINNCFMGIRLQPGEHEILMQFRPKEFFIGLIITGGYYIVLICLMIYGIKKRD